MKVDITDYIEPVIDVDISTPEALSALKQNFKGDIKAGAPRELIVGIYKAIRDTYIEVHETYMEYLGNIRLEKD